MKSKKELIKKVKDNLRKERIKESEKRKSIAISLLSEIAKYETK